MDWTGCGESVEQVGRPRFRAFIRGEDWVSTGDWVKTGPLGTKNGFDLEGLPGPAGCPIRPGRGLFREDWF
jgi:hypothetical protein